MLAPTPLAATPQRFCEALANLSDAVSKTLDVPLLADGGVGGQRALPSIIIDE